MVLSQILVRGNGLNNAMKTKIKFYIKQILGIFGALFAYGFLQSMYIIPIYKKMHLDYLALLIASTLFIFFCGFFYYYWQLHKNNTWNFNTNPFNFKFNKKTGKNILVLILGFSAMSIIQIFASIAFKNQVSDNQAELASISTLSNYLFKIMLAIVAPVCEELIFRGYFFNTFFKEKSKLNFNWGIIVNGFIFAMFHDPRLTEFFCVYWVLGSLLALIYLTTKDIRYSMLAHIANNTLGIL